MLPGLHALVDVFPCPAARFSPLGARPHALQPSRASKNIAASVKPPGFIQCYMQSMPTFAYFPKHFLACTIVGIRSRDVATVRERELRGCRSRLTRCLRPASVARVRARSAAAGWRTLPRSHSAFRREHSRTALLLTLPMGPWEDALAQRGYAAPCLGPTGREEGPRGRWGPFPPGALGSSHLHRAAGRLPVRSAGEPAKRTKQ